MVDMWARRYVEISLKEGHPQAKDWSRVYVPKDALKDVKIAVDKLIGVPRK